MKNQKYRPLSAGFTHLSAGFTLIEILVVIGMLAILSTVVLVAVNPLRQFAQAREAQRENDVAVILNAVSERIADNGGSFQPGPAPYTGNCSVDLPSTATIISKATLDLRSCLVSEYVSELPHDPSTGSNTCTSTYCANNSSENYNTGYTILRDSTTNRITVCAPAAVETALPGSTAFCLTR